MNSTRLATLALSVGALAAIGGCDRTDRRSDSTTTTGAGTTYGTTGTTGTKNDTAGATTTTGVGVGAIAFTTASNQIVSARCDREVLCKNVAPDKHFASRDVCTRELGMRMKDDLRPAKCPNGVDVKHLDDCLTAIAKEDCSNPIDSLTRISACNESGLCLEQNERPSR